MKNAIKMFIAALMIVATMGMTGCNASPNAGYQAVLVEKPVIFGHGGIDPDPVTTGLTFIAPTTDVIYVSMQPIAVEEKFTDLMSSDGVPLEFDAQIILQVTDSVTIVKNFGGDTWYPNNIEKQFQNLTRQAVRKYTSQDAAINSSAIDKIDAEVTDNLTTYLEKTKLPVKLIKVTVGKAMPPDAIKHQRIETAQQEQRVLTMQQATLAEDARKNAETARAQADNAYKSAMGLSPDQYVALERIKMQQAACTNPNSHCVFGGGSVLVDAK